MRNWNKMSLFKHQQIEHINANDSYDDLDRTLHSAAVVYDLTAYYIEKKGVRYAMRLARRIKKLFERPFVPVAREVLGKYRILYDVDTFTFGQYVELAFYLQRPQENAHYILASCSALPGEAYSSDGHKARGYYFLFQPVAHAIGSVEKIQQNIIAFNGDYKDLFGLSDDGHSQQAKMDKFNLQYGWMYSASAIAEYYRITLDQAYALPAREALNGLRYLKARSEYEIRERDRLMKEHKMK